MSTQSKQEKPPLTIQDIISTIESKSSDGGYIYRGERKLHNEHPYCGKVSSNLWREYCIENEHFDIEVIQKELLSAAKKHIGQLPQDYRIDYTAHTSIPGQDTDETIDFEILTDIQHYEGKTNLIDFTTDYFIALFFASDGSSNTDGRVILQKTEQIKNWIRHPQNPKHRVIAQKSVFVRHPRGFIEPQENDVVTIPAYLKQLILQHLRQYHGISTETIYNDLHGFIRNQDIHGDAYTHFCKGIAFYDRGENTTIIKQKQIEFEKAIEHYTKAIKYMHNFPEAYNNRGLIYDSMGHSDKAIEDLNAAIKLNPNYAGSYNNRGLVHAHKGNFDKAIQDFDTAIQLNPKLTDAHNNRGNVYRKKGDYEKAIKDHNTAIELNSRLAGAYNNRGLAYENKGDFDIAIRDFETAIQLDPNLIEAYSNRGSSFHKKGDFDEAIKSYNKAIEVNPYYAEAYNNRGFTYNSKNNLDQAIKDYKKAIELDPNYTTARNNLNMALQNRKKMLNQT